MRNPGKRSNTSQLRIVNDYIPQDKATPLQVPPPERIADRTWFCHFFMCTGCCANGIQAFRPTISGRHTGKLDSYVVDQSRLRQHWYLKLLSDPTERRKRFGKYTLPQGSRSSEHSGWHGQRWPYPYRRQLRRIFFYAQRYWWSEKVCPLRKKNVLTVNNLRSFQACEPQVFRVGDIVEAQLSFVVIPVKAGKRKMLTVLRSLALLDGAYTNKLVSLKIWILWLKLNLKQGERPQTLTALPTTLKRKVGYGNKEVKVNNETSEKRNKMDTT